jgi:repressor LexA
MIDAGIFDGDTVIIRNASNATPGDIVVALVDDEEATLKRFRRKALRLRSRPPTRPTRPVFLGPTGSRCKANWLGSSGVTD